MDVRWIRQTIGQGESSLVSDSLTKCRWTRCSLNSLRPIYCRIYWTSIWMRIVFYDQIYERNKLNTHQCNRRASCFKKNKKLVCIFLGGKSKFSEYCSPYQWPVTLWHFAARHRLMISIRLLFADTCCPRNNRPQLLCLVQETKT